ncbi:4Fe-4S binding protein [Methanobacterium alcaliphilum]|uniref:4Fe-4S binding protein n=1 Tax=Methanobacterium alcaliphilum TaxID=392018 RepID=UPI00200A83BE|nr:4Fe-4S binding protein [Methanobacterium alcaliphilum]MCK9150730.1 4Fe-4S binding protein [Methanobacterium alcaliphilum]
MSSVIWYLYEFARKSWAEKFADAKSGHDIVERPARFRDFPEVFKEYCIGCGACTAACPAPGAIKLVRDSDTSETEGLTYPVITAGACIRCGFCAEVCPTDPKAIECGENHLIREEFTILPVEKMFVIDDYLCIRCKKCMNACRVEGAITEEDNKIVIDQSKCIACGDCLKNCPVKGALKGIYISNVEEQKRIINLAVQKLEKAIEDNQDEIKVLPADKVLKMELPADELIEESLQILNNEEMVIDLIEKVTDRLKLRVITWDEEKCTKCRLCLEDCPSGAIIYDEEKGVKRDPDKCLRCSTCYQTCPFGVAGYYIAKFLLKRSPEEDVILITLKASNLPI